jgi:hypothetical protein
MLRKIFPVCRSPRTPMQDPSTYKNCAIDIMRGMCVVLRLTSRERARNNIWTYALCLRVFESIGALLSSSPPPSNGLLRLGTSNY